MDIRNSILDAIGNTPLVKLNRITRGSSSNVFIKLEYYNPTGSYKDRMALAIIEGAEKEGLLRPGYTVVEATGGSAGASLAFLCSVKGYKVKLVTSDAYSLEKRQTMKTFGAEVVIIPSDGGKVTGEMVRRVMAKAKELAKEPNTYFANQMENKYALMGYNKLGEEILSQLKGKVNAFVASFGSAACVMGVAEVLKTRNLKTKVLIVEPFESPMVSKGFAGLHHIEGIGDGLRPPLLKRDLYDDVVLVKEEDAKNTARTLVREEGIFAGSSTGANVQATLQILHNFGPDMNIVTVAADSGMKYLSTELYQ